MGDMGNKTVNTIIIIMSIIVMLGAIMYLFSFQSNAIKTSPVKETNSSRGSNGSVANSSQNVTAVTKNMISIPLEKPPFIKD